MFLKPKALLRVKGRPGEEIPGEPGDDKVLSKMIDAPLGDRTQVEARVAEARGALHPDRQGAHRARGHARHRAHLRPQRADVRRRRRGARRRRHRRRDHRPALAAPLRLGGDQGERPQDEPRALRQRGHRGDELRRAPDPAHRRGAVLRAARAAEAPRRRASSRASASPTRSRWRASRRRTASSGDRGARASTNRDVPRRAAVTAGAFASACARESARGARLQLHASARRRASSTSSWRRTRSSSCRARTTSRRTRSTPGVAKHTFCRVCGIHPFYTPRSHPDGVDVNVRCLDRSTAVQPSRTSR